MHEEKQKSLREQQSIARAGVFERTAGYYREQKGNIAKQTLDELNASP
jgi:hypothetical protein